jgi:hypothetical protein
MKQDNDFAGVNAHFAGCFGGPKGWTRYLEEQQ